MKTKPIQYAFSKGKTVGEIIEVMLSMPFIGIATKSDFAWYKEEFGCKFGCVWDKINWHCAIYMFLDSLGRGTATSKAKLQKAQAQAKAYAASQKK